MAVFTGGREDQHNGAKQLLEAFPQVAFGSRLRLEFMGSADHTFTSQVDRGRLLALIAEWVGRRPTDMSPNADNTVRYDQPLTGRKSA